ncbi:hypothetical protein Tco_0909077 [Tanacetum coccineum]|uniref:Uncharacterized protein n=1 Tax=Tanacetum coccineum TaxID=301880 RepID=A0ABQ5CRR5_9ASTR
METYSCEYCGGIPHPGFDCQTGNTPNYDQGPCYNQDFGFNQPPFYSPSQPWQFDCCEFCGGPHYSNDCQAGSMPFYDQGPYYNQNFSDDQPLFYSSYQQQQFNCCEVCGGLYYSSDCQTRNQLVDEPNPATIPERENDEFIKSSVDDLIPIPRESEVTSVCDDLECDMPITILFPTTDVREEDFDIAFMRISSRLLNGERGCDDSKPRSYDVTFSNPLFNFNDDSTLCNDNPLFDKEFEEDPPKWILVIDESTLLVTLPLPCTDILGDAIIDIDLLLGEHLDTLSTGDREINFNPSGDIEELERLLADDPVPELIAEFGLNDSIPTEIDDRYHDSEGDIIYFEQLLNEDTSSDVSSALLPTEFSLDLPLPDPKQICLREVERFDPFFSLTQSGGKTSVMETPSFGFHHMPSPLPAAYSPTEVMYCYYHPHLTSGDGFDHGPKMK